MSVEIVINWNFVREGAVERFSTGTILIPRALADKLEPDKAQVTQVPSFVRVLPLRSSVLAPGLAMPLSTR